MGKNEKPLIFGEHQKSKIQWSDNLLVGHSGIDETHREFVTLANALSESCEESAPTRLHQLEEHLMSHFDNEKLLMEKTEFPATDCHIEEHAKVFDAVVLVRERYSDGTASLNDIKRLAQALIDWFPGHIFYMDSALSTWVSKKTHNGSPLILHRSKPSSST
uniref:Hemerythrin HHE cation binding region n=1 Tax=Dechloromonas aromatica (strain RCB) TaxID=159087 RepID=Q47GE9_DECAR